MRCVFSPLAERDLEEIGDHIARDNPRRAVTFIKDIRKRCAAIAVNPAAASVRAELGPVIRMVPLGRYLTFYTVESEIVRIERILHGARDLADLFDD